MANIIRPCGYGATECGYCKGQRAYIVGSDPSASSSTYNVLADHLDLHVYEALLHRGWRRSGRAIYRPDNWHSCCPALTIRLPVEEFQPTKSQRKLARSTANLLAGKSNTAKTTTTNKKNSNASLRHSPQEQLVLESGIVACLEEWTKEALQTELQATPVSVKFRWKPGQHGVTLSTPVCASLQGRSRGRWKREALAEKLGQALRSHVCSSSPVASSSSSSTTTTPVKKSRVDARVSLASVSTHAASGQVLVGVRVQANDTKTSATNKATAKSAVPPKVDKLAAWLASNGVAAIPPPPYAWEISTLAVHESALDPEVHRLYFDYQHQVHGDDHPFAATTPAEDDDDHDLYQFAAEVNVDWVAKAKAMLEREYGQHVAKSSIIRSFGEFYTFLVDHPFGDGQPGAYHQHYRLAGQLVAVGVVDVLPGGLSSVYLFYDPQFAHELVPMGKFAILKEIEATQERHLPYYYLGYYIESCPKMRYKADYHPSQLLCPKTLHWVDADEAKKIIQRDSPERHCCQLYFGENGLAAKTNLAEVVAQIPLDIGHSVPVTLRMLHASGQDLVRPILEEFAEHAGDTVARRCTVRLR